jgi:hypothetical protein
MQASTAAPAEVKAAAKGFMLPKVAENSSGWGPSSIPEQFKDIPYQPFSKSDRLGKVPKNSPPRF